MSNACCGVEKVPMPLYVFFGAPGSGKGTLSSLCVEKLGWVHLSTGDLCRKHIEEKTQLGQQIDFIIKSGKLVDDSVIIEMIVQWLDQKNSNVSGIVLDGVTRTVCQAEGLLTYLRKNNSRFLLHVVMLDVSDDEIVKRLSSRQVCSNKDCQRIYSTRDNLLKSRVDGICDSCGSILIQRSDDNEATIRNRLDGYKRHIQPLVDFYTEQGVIVEHLNGQDSIEKVFENFVKKVGADSDSYKK